MSEHSDIDPAEDRQFAFSLRNGQRNRQSNSNLETKKKAEASRESTNSQLSSKDKPKVMQQRRSSGNSQRSAINVSPLV